MLNMRLPLDMEETKQGTSETDKDHRQDRQTNTQNTPLKDHGIAKFQQQLITHIH